MVNATAASLVALALKTARKELARKAAEPLHSRDWRLEGAFPLEARGKGRWHLRLDPADPLRLRHLPSRRCLCPAFREMDTDLASIPALARLAGKPFKALHLKPDSFPRSAVFHDALYDAGWCWAVEFGIASRARVTRAQADAILYLCLGCEGATCADGLAWHSAVRAGGAGHWLADPAAAGWPLLFGQNQETPHGFDD